MVVLLFTSVVLCTVVSTAGTLALGARGGGASERSAFQGLLAAEGGLNTFTVRAAEYARTKPIQASSAGTLTAWLEGFRDSGSSTGGLGFEGVAVSGSKATFTVVSRGRVLGATKVVLQDYTLTLDQGFRFRPRSALTSIPPIDATGSASISGQANSGVVTAVSGSVTLPTGGTTLTLPVGDTSGVLEGDYVRVSGATFRVDAKDDTSLKVTRVSAAPTSPLALSGDVTLMLNAVAGTSVTVSDPARVRASNHLDFTVGEKVTVGGKTAVVTKVGPDVGETVARAGDEQYLDLDWTDNSSSGRPSLLAEGTQIVRDVTAMRSAGNIDPKANKLGDYSMDGDPDCSSATVCEGENDPLLQKQPSAGSFFTSSLFGLSDAALDALVPLEPPVTSAFQMGGEVRRIRAGDLETAIKNKTSSGILIVDGDVDWTGGGNTTFNGFIYFRGNQGGKFNGNLTVNGGVAVRGGPIEGINSNDDETTDITGNLTLNYNAVQLRRYFVGNGSKTIAAVPGTWRQR